MGPLKVGHEALGWRLLWITFANQDHAINVLELQGFGASDHSTDLLPLQNAPTCFKEVTCLLDDRANSKAAFQGF